MAIYFPDGNGGRKQVDGFGGGENFSLAALKLTGFSEVADADGDIEDDDNLLTALAKLQNRRTAPEHLILLKVPRQNVTLTYNGEEQTPSWSGFDGGQMWIVEGSTLEATDAGTYSVAFALLDGYAWDDGSNNAKTVNWTIERATIEKVPSQSNTLFQDGTAKTPEWRNYAPNQLTIGGTTEATEVGVYTATFTPTGNFIWADGTLAPKSASWAIGSSVADAVPSVDATLSYTGEVQSPTWLNYDSSLLEMTGTTSATKVGNYLVTFTPKEGVVWADGKNDPKNVTWTITRASVAIPSVTVKTLTYNGNNQAPVVGEYNDALVIVTGNAPQINAGTYSVVCSLKDTENYQWTNGKTAAITTKWTIRKVSVAVPTVTNTTIEHDGKSHLPTIGSYDTNLITVTGNTAQTAMGTYTITFSLKNTTNYQWASGTTANQSVTWKIVLSYATFYSGVTMLKSNTMKFGTDVFILSDD